MKTVRRMFWSDGGKMLLLLPKDVLTYILSIVVYDYATLRGHCIGKTFAHHIVGLTTCQWFCHYNATNLSGIVRILSQVHPLIQKILLRACKTSGNGDYRQWGFQPYFFNTLSAANK